jgi:dienelactone hydrolase
LSAGDVHALVPDVSCRQTCVTGDSAGYTSAVVSTVDLVFEVDEARLAADAAGPPWTGSESATSRGLIVMVPGCGGDRFGPRTRAIASCLAVDGHSVVCTDLRPADELAAALVHGRVDRDAGLLAHRLSVVVETLASADRGAAGTIGLVGLAGGADVACSAASRNPDLVGGVVALAPRYTCTSTEVPVLMMSPDELLDAGHAARVAQVLAAWFRDRLVSPATAPTP